MAEGRKPVRRSLRLAPKPIRYGLSPDGNAVLETQYDQVPLRRYVTAALFVLLSAGILIYWTAFPLVNTIFFDGYPQPGSPPAPGPYRSARYTADWWMVWLLGLNWFLPMMLAFAMTNNSIEEYARLHKYFATLAMLVNLVVIVVLTVQWVFFCNTTFPFLGRACADYRLCCVYFPGEWCSNTTPCIPNVVSGDLAQNHEMFQHWVFGFVFLVMAYWHRSINSDLKEFGLLH
jgi:hypothetical protein